jgi:hypothetical protein
VPTWLHHLLSDLPMLLLVGAGFVVVTTRRAQLRGSAAPAFAGLGAWAAAVVLTQIWTQFLFVAMSQAEAQAIAPWIDAAVLALYGIGLLLLVTGMATGRPAQAPPTGAPVRWHGPGYPPAPPAFAPPAVSSPGPPPSGPPPSGQAPWGHPPSGPAPWNQHPAAGPAGPTQTGHGGPGQAFPGQPQPSEWARPPADRPHP